MSWRFAATSRAPGRAQPGPDPPVAGHEVDPVAGAGRQRGEQQRGVHRRVQPRHVLDPARPRCARCRAPAPPAGPARAARCGPRHCGCGRWPASRSSGRRRRGRTRAASRTRCPGRAPGSRPGRRARGAGPAGWAGACGTRTAAASGPCRRRRGSAAGRHRPSGPRSRTVTPTARRSPRRRGRSGGPQQHPVARGEGDPVPVAGGAGGRLPGVADDAADPAPAGVLDDAAPTRRRTPAGRCRSAAGSRPGSWRAVRAAGRRPASTATTSSQSRTVLASGRSTTGTSPRRSSSGSRPVMTIAELSAGPGPSRARRRAPRPRRRPRARPRGAARAGAPGWRGPAP